MHVWAAIHHGGKSELQILNETVNGARYKHLMENVALPYARGVFGENFVWQHDNAPAHKSHVVTNFLDEAEVTVLPWPATSPNLNPIENCWDSLKRAVYSLDPLPQNLRELATSLPQAWRDLDQNFINRLVESMPRRLESVIQARGCSTSY